MVIGYGQCSRFGHCQLPRSPAVSFSIIVLDYLEVGPTDSSQMVLAGLAVSFLFLSLTYYLIFAGDQRAAHSVLSTLGGLGLANWKVLPIVFAGP